MSKTATQSDVVKAWSEKVGREDQYDLVEIETIDGDRQTQLLDKDTGSITVAVNGTGGKVLQKLVDRAGDTFIDGAESPVEAVEVKSEKRYTSRGVLATPTQPENLEGPKEPTEVNPSEGREAKTADQLAERPEDKIERNQDDNVNTRRAASERGQELNRGASRGATGEAVGKGSESKSNTANKEK